MKIIQTIIGWIWNTNNLNQENCKCEIVEDEVCTQGQACEVCDPFFIEEEICTEESTSQMPTQVDNFAIRVVEFSNGGYKIRNIFARNFCLRINIPKGNYWVLSFGLMQSCQKVPKFDFQSQFYTVVWNALKF